MSDVSDEDATRKTVPLNLSLYVIYSTNRVAEGLRESACHGVVHGGSTVYLCFVHVPETCTFKLTVNSLSWCVKTQYCKRKTQFSDKRSSCSVVWEGDLHMSATPLCPLPETAPRNYQNSQVPAFRLSIYLSVHQSRLSHTELCRK